MAGLVATDKKRAEPNDALASTSLEKERHSWRSSNDLRLMTCPIVTSLHDHVPEAMKESRREGEGNWASQCCVRNKLT